MPVRNIFQTLIEVTDDALPAEELAALRAAVEARRGTGEPTRERSLRHGERIEFAQETLGEPAFGPLGRLVAARAGALTAQVYQRKVEQVRFSRFWVNFIPAGGFHHPHVHSGIVWANVFYVDAGESGAEGRGGGVLHFIDPRAGALVPASTGSGLVAVTPIPVEPKTNRLVTFPGYLQHYVTPYEGAGERIAMAINCRL